MLQPDGWLVGAGDFTNMHVQGHGEGEVLPTDCRAEGSLIPPDRRARRFIAHRCSGEGEAFVIPADGACQ